jgi:hypothetical protein
MSHSLNTEIVCVGRACYSITCVALPPHYQGVIEREDEFAPPRVFRGQPFRHGSLQSDILRYL